MTKPRGGLDIKIEVRGLPDLTLWKKGLGRVQVPFRRLHRWWRGERIALVAHNVREFNQLPPDYEVGKATLFKSVDDGSKKEA